MTRQKIKSLFDILVSRIKAYDYPEAKEIVFQLLDSQWGIDRTDLIMGETSNNIDELAPLIDRINQGEPIQYILEEAWFYGRRFYVDKHVLIPRPETEELIDYIKKQKPERVLDLGTGSGCIPVTLSLELPGSAVYAIDKSEDALEVARKNAKDNLAKVDFELADILDFQNPFLTDRFDLIVSNPPYVKESEKKEMRKNVLDFEPDLALFVPDNDPLVFYRNIGRIGKKHLVPDGQLWVEINAGLGRETRELFESQGYAEVNLIRDFFGKDRFIQAKLIGYE